MRVLDCRHPCLLHQRHYALKIDIIYLLRHVALADSVWLDEQPPRQGSEEAVGGGVGVQWLLLDVLSYLQSMNGMRRIVSGPHVQWESDEWQYAFEVEHDMQQIMELAIARLKPTTPQSHRPAQLTAAMAAFSPPASSRSASSHVPTAPPLPLPVALRCLLRSLGALAVLLTRDFLTDGILALQPLNQHRSTSFIWRFSEPIDPLTSFHLPLHRLFARLSVYILQLTPHALPLIAHFITQAIHTAFDSYPSTTSPALGSGMADAVSLDVWWRCFLCGPLRLSASVSEMRARLWLRNGDAIVGQQACYRSPSFALPGLYADVAAMHLAVMPWQQTSSGFSGVGKREERFDLLEWSIELYHLRGFITNQPQIISLSRTADDEPPSDPLSDSSLLVLAEDACRLWLAVLTDRTLYAADACVRSELLHCLAVHASPSHSTLLAALPESLSKSASLPAIDAALAELADFAPPAGTRGGVYRLKSSAWSEYNPFFFRYMTTEMATAEERFREHRKRQPAVDATAPALAATSERSELPAVLCELSTLLHRPALYRFIATVLQLFYAGHRIQLSPSASSVFSDLSSALTAPADCSLDRLMQAVLHLLAMAALTAPESRDEESKVECAGEPCSCQPRSLRRLPQSPSFSTCACLPFTVHQFAHALRVQPSSVASAIQCTAVELSTCETSAVHRQLAALGEMLLCLHQHPQIESWLAAEPRQQIADVLTLLTKYVTVTWSGSDSVDAMHEEQKRNGRVSAAVAQASGAEIGVSAPTALLSRDASSHNAVDRGSTTSPAPLSAAARAKLAAKERQAALLQQFKLKQERFQLVQQNRDGSSRLTPATKRQKHASESKQDESTAAVLANHRSASPSLSPVSASPSPSSSPSPPPLHSSSTHSAAEASAAGAPRPDVAGMLGHSSDSVCCLCLDPASADRLLGRVANVHLNGLLAVQHRQQMRALSEKVGSMQQQQHQQHEAGERVEDGGCGVCERTMPEHSFPLHPQLTAKAEAKAAESANARSAAGDEEKDGRQRKRSKRSSKAQSATSASPIADTPSTPTRSTRRQRSVAQLTDPGVLSAPSHATRSRSASAAAASTADAADVVMQDERKESDSGDGTMVLERVEAEVKQAELFEAPRHFSPQPSMHEVGFDFLHHWSTAARSAIRSTVELPAFPSLLVNSCGHLLHMNCYAGYVRTLHPSLAGSAQGETAAMESVSMAVMFPCPACRRMGNACLPLPFFSFESSSAEQKNQSAPPHSVVGGRGSMDAVLSKRLLAFAAPSEPTTDCQLFLSHWSAGRPSVSSLLAHTLVHRIRDEPHSKRLATGFSTEWQQLLRRLWLHYGLPAPEQSPSTPASSSRLLQSVITHTLLMWEMTNRNAAVNEAQPGGTSSFSSSSATASVESTSSTSPTPSTSSFLSPFSVRTAEIVRLLLFACERLQDLSLPSEQKQMFDDQRHLLSLLLPDSCTSHRPVFKAAAPQPLLLQQLLPILIRLSPVLFSTRTPLRPQLVSAIDGEVQSTELLRFPGVSVVVPLLYYAHILQCMLVISHVDAAPYQRKHHHHTDSHSAASKSKRRSGSACTTEDSASSHTVAEFEAAQRLSLPSLSELSLPLLPSSLLSSSSFLSLLSTCCMADVCDLSSLYLFVVACRLRLLTLPRSYSEHVRTQREQQLGTGARWLTLRSNLPRSSTTTSSSSSSTTTSSSTSSFSSSVLSTITTMTAALHSQLRCTYVAFDIARNTEEHKHDTANSSVADGRHMERDWQLPTLSSLDPVHHHTTDSSTPATPLFSSQLLSLLYMWLVDYWQSCMPPSQGPSSAAAPRIVKPGKNSSKKRKAQAEAVVAADAIAHPATNPSSSSSSLSSSHSHPSLQTVIDSLIFPFGSIRCLPCPAVDLSVPLYLSGLPRTFQSLLCSGPVRRCPHCRSERSSLPSPSSVASVLLCLLCGSYVCANSRNKCHLLHVGTCEGDRGCFLSLKRGDCVIIRLDQQQAAMSAAATVTADNESDALSGDNNRTASPALEDNEAAALAAVAAVPNPNIITIPPTSSTSTTATASSTALALSSFSPSPCVSMSTYSYCNWPSLYLDAYGESDLNLVRGRPLFLNATRQQALLALLTQHGWEEHIQAAMAAQRLQQQQQQQHHQHTQQQHQQQMRMQQRQQQQQQQAGRRVAAAVVGTVQNAPQPPDATQRGAALAERGGDRRRHGRDRSRR